MHASKRELERTVFDSLNEQLSGSGFVLKVSKNAFLRHHHGITDIFQLGCLDGKPGCRIQPHVGVRIDLVEDIFHRSSGFEAKYQKDTPTIGGAVGNIMKGSSRACEFQVELKSEVPPVTENILSVFRDFALPYFDRFGSLQAIDAELNDKPIERTPHRVAPWLREATGVIVAKLTARPNYNQLVAIYTKSLSSTNNGFYLERFQRLVKSLDSDGMANLP